MDGAPGSELGRVWHHRDLLWLLAATDLRLRYKGSALGFLWGLLHPLVLMAILAAVFTHLLASPIDRFALFLLAGVMPWTFVAQGIARATTAVLAHAPLLRKAALPPALFPLASALASLANFCLAVPVLLGVGCVLGARPCLAWAYLPVGIALLGAFVAGCACLVASANVFFRDVQHLTELLLALLFYLTPVIYPLDRLPAGVAAVLQWNPVAPLLEGIRAPLYASAWPAAGSVAAAAAAAAAACLVGGYVLRRTQDRFLYHA